MITENDSLSRGFDAGNYDNSYVSENYMAAISKRIKRYNEYEDAHPGAFRGAYMLGFFSSYENYEIPPSLRSGVREAEAKYGAKMRAIGIAVEPRSRKRKP